MQQILLALEKKLGYSFKNKRLLEEAFTHSTYAHLHGGKDNERLEFLGDTVLQFVVTEYLYAKHETATEGELTELRAGLVCERSLLEVVEKLSLAQYLRIEGSLSNGGKKTVSSLYETVVGAIYLDGGLDKAGTFIKKTLLNAVEEKPNTKDAKTRLQEYLQSIGAPMPEYETQQSGKDNAPTFHCTVRAQGKTAFGEGKSKKSAEKQAAEKLLLQFKPSGEK